MKVLNLYAGIGGNRKLWEDVEVTAVEMNPKIAAIYQDFFPNDKVIVGDAHQYLLEHFKEFEFIWSSPPCPSHSKMRRNVEYPQGRVSALYPDMRLYEEIILLRSYCESKWCVENVISYYKPLIIPQEVGGHYFWSNFHISDIKISSKHHVKNKREAIKHKNIDLTNKDCGQRKDQVIRNCVNSYLGLHILNESKRDVQPELFGRKQNA